MVVQLLSRVWLCDPMDYSIIRSRASLSFTVSQILLKLMCIVSVMPSNNLILCHPLLLLPSVFPTIRFFSNESALWIRWRKYWSFNFSISPSNKYSGLISFRIDWFDFLGFPGTHDKESACNAKAWVWFLSQEDFLEKGMATHFCILAWKTPWIEA